MAVDVRRARVEEAIGRELRDAETAIDVLLLDQALNQAKDDVEQAIREEMIRAVEAWAGGSAPRPTVYVTEEMIGPLNRLAELGQAEALNELRRLGYDLARPAGETRRFAADPLPPADRDLRDYLGRNAGGLTVRIEDELVAADLAGASRQAIAQALLDVPGARDIASRIVSTALAEGLTLTFDANQHLVEGWEYTAVMDAATCPSCASLDGKQYRTLAELYVDLPNFGPNPHCHGGGRCRCRGLPARFTGTVVPPAAETAEPDAGPAFSPAELADGPPRFATTAEAESWIVERGLADEVRLGTIEPEGAREIADALAQTLGPNGVKIQTVELDPTSKKSIARYRFFERSRSATEIDFDTRLQIKRVVANSKTVTARAAKEHDNYLAQREAAVSNRRRQALDETRPQVLRDRAQEELAKIEAASQWATWSTSPRPTFSIIVHEAAHAVYFQRDLERAWKAALKAREVTLLERFQVSEYAATSADELFAEAVALRVEGRPLPDSIRDALEDVLPEAGLDAV